mmetsp:Transcript_31574/g.27968  ORF Transcript_31574/g.27968 Transcript_31574/m.27968 type:complete len:119 (+) Transcript_31574:422-778(+)
MYKTIKNFNYKVDDELSPQQIFGRQQEQEIERIKILRNIKKKSLHLQEKKSRYIPRPVMQNEEEFIKRLDTTNSTLKRNRQRLALIHQKKYSKQWDNPHIMRISRSKDFFPNQSKHLQ